MTECSNYNQQPGWIREIRLGWMPGHACGATRGCRIWPRCRDMHKVGSCHFPRGKNRKQLPRFPKWGCRRRVWMPGACRAAKGHGGGARWGHRAQRDTGVVPPPKRDLQRAVVSPWGGSAPCAISHPKGPWMAQQPLKVISARSPPQGISPLQGLTALNYTAQDLSKAMIPSHWCFPEPFQSRHTDGCMDHSITSAPGI